MSKDIFLAPCVSASAKENFNKTVLDGVSSSDIPPSVQSLLSSLDQTNYFWGTGNKSTWQSCEAGDLVLFYPESGKFTHVSTIKDAFQNIELSKKLWPNYEDEPWEGIMLIEEPTEISLDINTFNALFEYSDSFVPQGFTRVADGSRASVEEQFGSVDNFAEALRSGENLNYSGQAGTNTSSNLQLGFQKILDSYQENRRTEQYGSDNALFKEFKKLEDELSQVTPVANRENMVVKASPGKGNWATIPWVSIYDARETQTIQEGVQCVYLFREDMSGFYLTFMQGVTEFTDQYGRVTGREKLDEQAEDLKKNCSNLKSTDFRLDNNIDLKTGHDLGLDYEHGTIAYKFYDKGNLPDDEELVSDLNKLLNSYENYLEESENVNGGESKSLQELPLREVINRFNRYLESKGFHFEEDEVKNFVLSLKTKPFVILAGISGTGKTKLAQLFAKFVGQDPWLISVKPNWTDNSDLLGYQNLQDEFQEQTLTEVLKKANKKENEEIPHFVILDEMNLARVEHYFSDFLSKMETRTAENGRIESEPIFEDEFVDNLKNHEDVLRSLRMKENLYIIGTVNMDETTHPFSRKVLDRANSLEFNDVELSQINSVQDPPDEIELSNDVLKAEYVRLDPDLYNQRQDFFNEQISALEDINEILRQGDFQVGYRVRDELCLYLHYADREDILTVSDAFDFQLKQKILPRLQGSTDTISDILHDLYEFTTSRDYNYDDAWSDNEDITNELESFDEENYDYPRSARKILRMQRRYLDQTFTSFWV